MRCSISKAPHDKKFERQVCLQGRTLLQQMSDKSLLHPFTEEAAMQKRKPATVPGYDNIHVESLMNLGPTAHTWLSKFFSRIMATHSTPKIWGKAKVIAVEKPGKDLSLAANYRPISLLTVCYKLFERLALQRILPQSKVYSVQTRLVSRKVEALVTRLLPSPLSSKIDSSRT